MNDQISHVPAGLHEAGDEGVVPTEFLTGQAGTGKTFEILRRIQADPAYGVLAATTGIAAMNLGTITINSLLKYFDTDSLEEAFFNGWLTRKLRELVESGYKWIVIDEISMMDARQLDLIYQATKLLNEQRAHKGEHPLGIVVTGDFCQLPPIKAEWVFNANCWPSFEATTTRLTKVWRQADADFLAAINAIRSGDGGLGSALLSKLGVNFVKSADSKFDGTTIMARNKSVDGFNWLSHSKLPGIPAIVRSHRLGEQRAEWKHIPDELALKDNSLVMILSNDTPDFTYVNGDCGHIEHFDNSRFSIKLLRNGDIVDLGMIQRKVESKNPPESYIAEGIGEKELRKKYMHQQPDRVNKPYWDPDRGRWVTGAVTYYPIRLAYASTVHKTQGLTLDRIQVDVNDHFFGSPSMMYVALSRCRTAGGLQIVGSPGLVSLRTKLAEEVKRWL